MDNSLPRSVRLLDKSIANTQKKQAKKTLGKFLRNEVDFTFAIDESEIRNYMENTYYDETFRSVLDDNKSLTGSVIRANEPWKVTTDSLHMEFFEIMQTIPNTNEVLSVVADFSRCCSDALNVVRGLKSKVAVGQIPEETWLENERNTWRLLYVLLGNRLNSSYEEDMEMVYSGPSEKYCMLSLFKREPLVREIQLVIDWLECNASQKEDRVLNFSDTSIGWENTLHQITAKETISFEASSKIVKHLDPDAPHRERLPLHDLDMQDEKKLCKQIFSGIRCGKLDDVQKLCCDFSHPWRAALLEGWKLYHNPNLNDTYSQEFDDVNKTSKEEKYKEIEGNENRDLWKASSWQYVNFSTLNPFEKASVAAYSGNLETLLQVCSSWEDYLWAYFKVMIDVKVETELRENVTKSYMEMPQEYWDQKMSINEIFEYLESSRISTVKNEAITKDHLLQKHIILDETNKLIELIINWIIDPDVTTQFLRFLTHFLLFLDHIGKVNNKEVVEKVLEEYIKRLVEMRMTQLIAFYSSKITNELVQMNLFSMYLETIVENDEREEALNHADDCGINLSLLTKTIVENIRGKHDLVPKSDFSAISELDEFKIQSLDWLLFYENHLSQALHQTNALIFLFLTQRKIDAAQLAFNKLPVDVIQKLSEHGLPEPQQTDIKEFLSYKAYLDAQEAFNLWYKYFKSKPIAPVPLTDNAPFAEKVVFEHKVSQHKADVELWKLTIAQLAKTAKNSLYNVILFPDGWLKEAKDSKVLQSTCIPECVILLYSVLYNSEKFEDCVRLADIVASEKHKIYRVYSSEKLKEFLTKIGEASLALLRLKKDPWGYEMSA